MRKALSFFFALVFLLVGLFSFRMGIPFFEINQALVIRNNLVKSGVDFSSGGVFVSEVNINSPASQVGIKEGSQITHINGNSVTGTAEFISIVNNQLGKSVQLTVCESKKCRQIDITPREKQLERQGPLGIVIYDISQYNKSALAVIYDQVVKRFTGRDFFSGYFGRNFTAQSHFFLVLGILSTFITIKLISSIIKRKHS